MSNVAEKLDSLVSDKVLSIIAQQRRLLKRFADVSHYLEGVVAGFYLPGIDQTFDNPVKRLTGRRPPLLTLEVKNDSLIFSGAISRPRNNKLTYSVIFSYDVSMVYSPRGGGKTLPANNVVLARRANELLAGLVSYGRRVSFNMHEELKPLMFPRVVHDENDKMVAEDYTPVLGFETENPARTFDAVSVRRPNPADKILARRGIDYPLGVTPPELDDMVVEFKAEFPGVELDWSAVVEALLFRKTFFTFQMAREEAVVAAQEAVVATMREALPQKYRWEASFNDLLLAAKNPQNPVRVSRLSALQLFPVETAYDFPAEYSGTVLTPNNWAPSSIRQAVMQETA